MSYFHGQLVADICALKREYPFLSVKKIGESVMGRSILCAVVGSGQKKIFLNGAHHGLESLTSMFLVEFLHGLLKNKEGEMFGYNIKQILKRTSIFIAPMVNPDGVEIVVNGLDKENPYYPLIEKWGRGGAIGQTWQANIRGVDLNHNYDAGWQESKNAEKENAIFGPGPTRYSGAYPESEPESRAVANFTREQGFDLAIAFHSQGEVIYWDYLGKAGHKGKRIATQMSKASGYELDSPQGMASFAGYKDWFIKRFSRPGYTVEIGWGVNPLPVSKLAKVYGENCPLILSAALLA